MHWRGFLIKKIFVVEDDRKSLDLFKAVLNTIKNIEIITEKRGNQALHKIKEEKPDLIILDIQLPEMSGIEICKALRGEGMFMSIPIIAVTAYVMEGDEERIMEAGFTKYISKPIRVKEFRKVISEFLSQ